MLNEHEAAFEYREYTTAPLSSAELKSVLKKLGVTAQSLLRKNDKAYKALEWTGDESQAEIVRRMVEHPTLLQRPIAVKGNKAVVGRPVDNLLDLL